MSDIEYIKELPSGKYRLSTKEEIKEALKIKAEREKLQEAAIKLSKLIADCKHNVCYDVEGYIYHSRYCLACGSFIGSI